MIFAFWWQQQCPREWHRAMSREGQVASSPEGSGHETGSPNLKLLECKECLDNTQKYGLVFRQCCVETGTGLDDPCRFIPKKGYSKIILYEQRILQNCFLISLAHYTFGVGIHESRTQIYLGNAQKHI